MVRTPSLRESRERVHLDDTVPKSLATVLEKRLLLYFTEIGSKIKSDISTVEKGRNAGSTQQLTIHYPSQ